ncbi:hypothetical protein N182_31525 [Sinorhizobium sp. GL2]|nr:hypothetical protein N182_31525 [Sinorhizobium sp. GL2]
MHKPLLADGREFHLAFGAIEKPQSEFSFQRLDRLTERRLRHVEAFGGAAEMKFLGNRHELANLSQVHVAH